MRTKLYYCKMSRCLAEIVWRDDGSPICFYGNSGVGNVCEEPYSNFVSLPLEPILWCLYGVFKRIMLGFRRVEL